MARPSHLRLDSVEQPWQPAPMPGANRPLELVRLESSGDTFAILGRFPAGFERPVSGGYTIAEEFVVLKGELELEGTAVAPGTLCSIPAHHRRAPMRSPDGCTVLAWFSGPPRFRPAEELSPSAGAAAAFVAVGQPAIGDRVLDTSEAGWTIADPASLESPARPIDVVDLGWTWWTRLGAGPPRSPIPAGPVLVRLPRGITAPATAPTSP